MLLLEKNEESHKQKKIEAMKNTFFFTLQHLCFGPYLQHCMQLKKIFGRSESNPQGHALFRLPKFPAIFKKYESELIFLLWDHSPECNKIWSHHLQTIFHILIDQTSLMLCAKQISGCVFYALCSQYLQHRTQPNLA